MTVGETFLAAVLQVVFDRLASREVVSFFRSAKFDQSLVNKLKGLMLATGKLLLDAEEKQLTNHAVKQWVDELKHWFYRAEELVNDVATEALRLSLEKESPPQTQSLGTKVRNLIPAFSDTSLFRNAITPKIREVVEMLETMLRQKDVLGLREISVGKATQAQRVPSTYLLEEDSEVYGRDKMKNKILEFLLSKKAQRNRINVVAIVGMGGIGKTTLAKFVFNDGRLKETFDTKVWVCVSDQFDISRVTRSILESVAHKSYPESHDLNFLQTKLSTKLKEKRFLLVLDDVWNEKYEDWESLRAPFSAGAYDSKIILTTRNYKVAKSFSIMRTALMFRLEPLSNDDSWSLFSRHAFGVGNSIFNPCLEEIGKKVVQRCKGLPLAIKTLGGLLRFTDEIREWEAILQSNLWDLSFNESNVIPALWLSYYHLPSHLKRCFSYCAIFPKDYKIERKQLVLLWLAENFVLPNKNERRMEDVGDDYLEQLLSRSFLEPVDESFVTMHDLMHDLAQVLSGEFLLRNELESPTKLLERARHFSYVADTYDGITKFQAIHESKHLRTFLALHDEPLHDSYYLTNRVTTAIIPHLSCLRVLSLSRYENLRLPESIGSLKQLCYLDVSYTKIAQLPESVSTLYNLQTLLLLHCSSLKRLPKDMGNLVLLRHLDISGTPLLKLPKGIGKLKSLQTLTDFVVGKKRTLAIQELAELQQIRGKIALRRLQNVADPSYAFHVNLSSRKFIDELALEFDSEDYDDSEKARELLGNLEPPRNLKKLTIRHYAGTRFPKWLDAECAVYTNLTNLCISGCRYCFSLPPLGQLPAIKELVIKGMKHIISVDPEFYGHNSSRLRGPFATLESLRFEKMEGWEVWSKVDVEGNAVCFPRLKKLHLHDCPKLKGNLPIHVPSLVEVEIDGCPQLGRLLPQVPSIHPLEARASLHAELASAIDVTSITSLRLVGLVQLVSLPPEVVTLSSLHDLEIVKCDNLKSLANVQLPPLLKSLAIKDCEILESLPEGMKFLKHLWNLRLKRCECLRWAPGNMLPTSLGLLDVRKCERLEFPIPTERMQHYTSLYYIGFFDAGNHFVSFPLGLFPNLRDVEFWNCKGLKKVYIPEGIDDNRLVCLTSVMFSCPELEIIGKETGRGGATVLSAPNLTRLYIRNCEKLKPVMIEMEGKALLPKLELLIIDKSHRLASELGVSLGRNLLKFSCLTVLDIQGEEVECFPDPDEGWASLPTSLRALCIEDFPKLRRVDGKALQTLTSLQLLSISNCPKLERLPEEGLPPSLGYLDINRCPMVEERCQPEKGLDWSKIHHIPCVGINCHCITGP